MRREISTILERTGETVPFDRRIRARRVHDLLDGIADVGDDGLVPPTSLLREFIGGSAYDLH